MPFVSYVSVSYALCRLGPSVDSAHFMGLNLQILRHRCRLIRRRRRRRPHRSTHLASQILGGRWPRKAVHLRTDSAFFVEACPRFLLKSGAPEGRVLNALERPPLLVPERARGPLERIPQGGRAPRLGLPLPFLWRGHHTIRTLVVVVPIGPQLPFSSSTFVDRERASARRGLECERVSSTSSVSFPFA